MYDQVINNLRESYNRMVGEREKKSVDRWKAEERNYFFSLLQKEGKNKLLEIGAGTGIHGKFFQDNGLDVICTDLSPEMITACQKKGLNAYEMDFLHLDFPDHSFDAIFAMNCLLHVPKNNLDSILQNLQRLLKPGGLFYLGQYGGIEREGIWPEDHYQPKRYFSFLSDTLLKKMVTSYFEIDYFKQIPLDDTPDNHFQSLILRAQIN